MISYIMKYEDKAAARLALAEWAYTDVEGDEFWGAKPHTSIREITVGQEAVYDYADIDNPVETTPKTITEGYWLSITIPVDMTNLRKVVKADSALYVSSNNIAGVVQFTETQLLALVEESRQRKKQEVLVYSDNISAALTSEYSQAEKDSFPAKLPAAEAVIAGTATQSQTELLTAEAEILGITITELAPMVIAKGEVFNKITSNIAGFRRKTYVAIDAADTEHEIYAVMQTLSIEAQLRLQQILSDAAS